MRSGQSPGPGRPQAEDGAVDQRLEREEQVIAALRAGDRTAEAIVARVYRGIRESLAPLAQESVTAHLQKLQHEGRARIDQEAWTMIDP